MQIIDESNFVYFLPSTSNSKLLSFMNTILLLFASNVFMTFAWYGNLKFPELPMWKAILISWGIAFFEYSLMVPANRLGFIGGNYSASQLKIIQEGITLTVFVFFSVFYLKEEIKWNYVVSFVLILAAVFVAFKKWD
jgi:hypothetical protein